MSGETKKPLVSFIIVAYNCADLLEECVKSVLQFGSGQVIVIDNASTDNTREVLKSFEKSATIILNDRNMGYTIACNQGIKAATSEYIFLLNPDAYLKNDSWNLLLDKLETDRSVDAMAPNLYYPGGELQHYIRRFPTIHALLVEFFVPSKWWKKFTSYRRYTCEDLDLTKAQPLEQPAGAALLFRANYLMDERFFIYGSDLELCKRIWTSGKKILLGPDAAVFHHQSKGGTGSGNMKLRTSLKLDALYGYGLYFREHHGIVYYNVYKIVFSLLLGVIVLLNMFSGKSILKDKWVRFTGFLTNKNFRHFKA